MTARDLARAAKNRLRLFVVTVKEPRKEHFECPVCGYRGPFLDVAPGWGERKHAECPRCNALERHRLQFVVMNQLLENRDTSRMRMLHFAPEPCFRELFSKRFGRYESADLNMPGVDHKVNLVKLPFPDATYDFVFASHVLEHIREDEKAISELRRVLKPGGIAVLPVPIVAARTVEYPEPSATEGYHVRAPGYDYFKRYERYFSKVERISSETLPDRYQPFVYEDRTVYPTKACPWRPAMAGERHVDIVPVCYV
jgi:hypothetical protein